MPSASLYTMRDRSWTLNCRYLFRHYCWCYWFLCAEPIWLLVRGGQVFSTRCRQLCFRKLALPSYYLIFTCCLRVLRKIYA